MKTFKLNIGVAVGCILACVGYQAFGAIPYFEGFETTNRGALTGDASTFFSIYNSLTCVGPGGGALGLTPPHGTNYAEYASLEDHYDVGMGDAGSAKFGGRTTYGGDFYQAFTLYVDLNWLPPTAPLQDAFWVDEKPSDASGTANQYGDENHFGFAVPSQGNVKVYPGAGQPAYTFPASGWYQFVMTFRKGAGGYVENDFLVYNPSGQQVAMNVVTTALVNAELGGNGTAWWTAWQNGFANNVVGIEDIRTGYLPFLPYKYSEWVQEFETDTYGIVGYTSITRVGSGGGTLGLASPRGRYHAELVNQHDRYDTGLGSAGYCTFGGPSTYRAVYIGDFYQSVTVYIDPINWQTTGGLWLDETPSATGGTWAGTWDWNDETHFGIGVTTPGTVNVSGDVGSLNITRPGWYQFVQTFRKGATDTNKYVNDFMVYSSHGQLLVSNSAPSYWDTQSGNLGGNGLLWITVWNNGWANDIMALDDLRSGLLPFVPRDYPSGGTAIMIW